MRTSNGSCLNRGTSSSCFSDAKYLCDVKAYCLKTQQIQVIPWVNFLIGSFSCRSASPANQARAGNKSCVQKGFADTGETWGFLKKVRDRKKPDMVF